MCIVSKYLLFFNILLSPLYWEGSIILSSLNTFTGTCCPRELVITLLQLSHISKVYMFLSSQSQFTELNRYLTSVKFPSVKVGILFIICYLLIMCCTELNHILITRVSPPINSLSRSVSLVKTRSKITCPLVGVSTKCERHLQKQSLDLL